ncbi:MAG: Lipopolysaccharide assembly protein A [Candidatus Marinimicrobia bacterium]|nr:Lipopolysaccharide assembly protein A [Candidatus Neomarinimicrobiota bacterium]
MGLLKIFVTIVLMAVLLWFLALNVDQTIQELQIFTATIYDVNLVHVLLASFLIGIFVGFLIPVFQVLNSRAEVRKYERENRKLKSELNELRNVAIDEDVAALPEQSEQQSSAPSHSNQENS